MAIEEEKVRQETYKNLYAILDSNKPDGWVVLSAYPYSSPTFPCIVIRPASSNQRKETLNFSRRTNRIMVQLDFYDYARNGKVSIDNIKDRVSKILFDKLSDLKDINLQLDEVEDIEADSFVEGNQKINYGGLIVRFKLLK